MSKIDQVKDLRATTGVNLKTAACIINLKEAVRRLETTLVIAHKKAEIDHGSAENSVRYKVLNDKIEDTNNLRKLIEELL